MHPKYVDTVQQVTYWAASEPGIHALVLIGSQARSQLAADEWSDLDLMVLVDDPGLLLGDAAWLEKFGRVVCWFDEVVPLPGRRWRWQVRRTLYTDSRDVDFSILPHDYLAEVLDVNREILRKGWQVLSEDQGGSLAAEIVSVLGTSPQAHPLLAEEETRQVVSNLLYHVIWALKKLYRGEVWVATSCINSYMKDLLLQLVEAHNAVVTRYPDRLGYNGRFLERRSDPAVIARLQGCFTRYDPPEAVASLRRMVDIVEATWREICAQTSWRYDAEQFEQVKAMYADISLPQRA